MKIVIALLNAHSEADHVLEKPHSDKNGRIRYAQLFHSLRAGAAF